MSFLFNRNRQKSPQELVRNAAELVVRLESMSDRKRGLDELTRLLSQIRFLLYGDADNDPVPDQIAAVAQEVYHTDLLVHLADNFQLLDFDTRKDVVFLFCTLLRRQIGNRSPTVDYLAARPRILNAFMKDNSNPETGLNCGTIIRECAKHEVLARQVLASPELWHYFDYMIEARFDVALDAFSTLDEVVTIHPQAGSEFLLTNADRFIEQMNTLLTCENYAIKRQSLKLMATLIQTRTNSAFMTEYINDVENLKLVMRLLRDKSKNIQFETFDIFKVFVANPRKSRPVYEVLSKNRIKLLNFLATFNPEREDDQFREEKAYVIRQITALPAPAQPPTPPAHDVSSTNPSSSHSQPVLALSQASPILQSHTANATPPLPVTPVASQPARNYTNFTRYPQQQSQAQQPPFPAQPQDQQQIPHHPARPVAHTTHGDHVA